MKDTIKNWREQAICWRIESNILRKQLDACKSVLADAETQRDMNWAECDALRAKLDVALTDLHDSTAQLVMDNEIIVVLQAKLDVAVEAIDLYKSLVVIECSEDAELWDRAQELLKQLEA